MNDDASEQGDDHEVHSACDILDRLRELADRDEPVTIGHAVEAMGDGLLMLIAMGMSVAALAVGAGLVGTTGVFAGGEGGE